MEPTPLLTIQYLEGSPAWSQLDHNQIVNKLRSAAERLPFSHLLIGWNVPLPLLEACRVEAEHLGMRFLLWQPLLTPCIVHLPDPDWCVTGLNGGKLVGYRDLPEFTFVCPNHPAVQEAVSLHVEELIHQGLYHGFFLDRVRFPSPAKHPPSDLACFCDHCQRRAAEYGLDLKIVKKTFLESTQRGIGSITLVKSLLSGKIDLALADQAQSISQFFAFRKQSVCDFLSPVTWIIRNAHLEIGLDCFSPSLAHMVGQDLAALGELVDWIKLMTYAHTLAPAGLPFELSGIIHHLTSTAHISEGQALDLVSQTIGLPLPTSCSSLEKEGLSSTALSREVSYGISLSSLPVLAGIELVDSSGITDLNPEQITSDLRAVKQSGAGGLALSWDLLHIPLKRLDLVRQVYLSQASA